MPPAEVLRVYRKGLAHLVEQRAGGPLGDYLEFGVFRGDSMLCMHRALDELGVDGVRLFGFDSFEGLPDVAPGDEDLGWAPGAFHSDYEMTRRRLTKGGVDWDRTTLVKGWYDETLTDALRNEHELRRASVIMIDCDLYSSSERALEFVAPLIHEEVLVLLDDWDGGTGLAEQNIGERRAFEEFLERHPELSAREFDTYYHTEMEPPVPAKVFAVSRNTAGTSGA